MTPCLNETTVLAFLAGTLPPAERAGVESHVAACSACAEVLTWAAADSANVSRAPGQEGPPFLGQLAPGARVDRYQVLGPIGRGGMGEVYAAYHPDLDRRIALKIVFESGADATERRARLLREARAIARLSHPNVVTVFDAGTVGDRVYIAMEFIDGVTLDEWLRAQTRGWAEILDVFVAAGRGLAAAHAARIIHRDFKPQNVMIANDGAVRVMDFGLAQLVREEVASNPNFPTLSLAAEDEAERLVSTSSSGTAPLITRATKTGELLGTPAYMAPEQWRGQAADARGDQFSFCVALYEALFGARPTLGLPGSEHHESDAMLGSSPAGRRRSVPAWLREIVNRGLALNRDDRFPSMDQLLASVGRSRVRTRRRTFGAAAAVVLAVGGFGGWRVSHARRFDCEPPRDRIAAAWPTPDLSDSRRGSIHDALFASTTGDAQTIWRRLSSTLDHYMTEWTSMYREVCEATNVRGEQSEDVLDLRMRCLKDNLDQVRAFTDGIALSRTWSPGNVLGAMSELTPVGRCADIRLLRSAVPLPRDTRTLMAVQALQATLRDAEAMGDLGHEPGAVARLAQLAPKIEATGYKPLLAQMLELQGRFQTDTDGAGASEVSLRRAFAAAVGGGDDITAAKAATHLAFSVGYLLGREAEGISWVRIADASLDRSGPGNQRIRGWVRQSEGSILGRTRRFSEASAQFEQAVALKEQALGPSHPDVAISLIALANMLKELGELPRALAVAERALAILAGQGQPYAYALNIDGEVLQSLGRRAEARAAFERSLQTEQAEFVLGDPLTGLGRVKLDSGDAAGAIPLLERGLRIRDREWTDPTIVAESRFALAQALWASGSDHSRALSLATAARRAYADARAPRELGEVETWLATHAPKRRQP